MSSLQEQDQHILSVKALEEAVSLLLNNNFDADSSACLMTILKIVDNVLQKPGNEKVRQLRLDNATVQQKVASRKGAIELLQACGFERQSAPAPLLSTDPNGGEPLLVLAPRKEDQKVLITARRCIETHLIHDLSMDPNQIPPYRPPPPPLVVTASTATTSAGEPGSFNVYGGHRFDAKSAAVGQQLGPPPNYVSKTTTQLTALQQKQQQLEQSREPVQRQWQAFGPPTSMVNSVAPQPIAATTSGGAGGAGDSSLLAARLQKQAAERKQREEGGFTTSAMRELERLKKQKVYSHVTLTIQFPSGHSVRGQFGPQETIAEVMQALQTDCLIATSELLFDLYMTPPRRLLPPKNTLKQEGLEPAAKIYVSWKTPAPTDEFLQPQLFEAATETSFPTAQPVVPSAAEPAAAPAAAAAPVQKKKKKSDRQEEMLKRMMGGGL